MIVACACDTGASTDTTSETSTAATTARVADTADTAHVQDTAHAEDTVQAQDTMAVPDDLVEPEGFSTVSVRIVEADGEACEVCVWLADSADERSRGLMGVTDLGGAAGMLFVFDAPAVRSFYMFQTPSPLSIAWFDARGAFVDSTDMSPCLAVPAADCLRYAPDDPYLTALEVFPGALDDLGIGPGSTLEILAADCDSPSS